MEPLKPTLLDDLTDVEFDSAMFRQALAPPPVDIADAVMQALADGADEASAAPLRSMLRAAVAPPEPLDFSDDIMALLAEDSLHTPNVVGDVLRDHLADAALAGDGVADDVMALLGAEDPSLRDALRAAVESPPLDLSDAIFSAIQAEGEPDSLGDSIRAAVQAPVDVWPVVADAIGAEPVTGWSATAQALREAVQVKVDVSDAVMAAIQPQRVSAPTITPSRAATPVARHSSHRRMFWAPVAATGAVFGMAAALILVLRIFTSGTTEVNLAFAMAALNDLQVEDLSTAEGNMVQVMQFEENGPTFIIIDDAAGGSL